MSIHDIGARIRELRLQKGMTQEQLAQALHLSPQAVSKWENHTTTPDIGLLPELSVQLGCTIDQLFSLSDRQRFDRIDNMLEDIRFLPENDFLSSERWLKSKLTDPEAGAEATLILSQLYNKRAKEYRELAAPLARKALLLNPEVKGAHNAIFDAETGLRLDWNYGNHWQLIDFYKAFLKEHPHDHRNYLWLMDLLLADGRTAEARATLEQMKQAKYTYHYHLYDGLIAKAECDLPRALVCWEKMTDENPDLWVAWACKGDSMAQLCRYDEAIACYRKAMTLQPQPRYTDSPEAIAQISEIRGDLRTAIEMRQECLRIIREEWNITEGELVDKELRELDRLRAKHNP